MKRIFVLFILLVYNMSYSQTEDAWVYLKDKPDAETFLDNPLSMLTQRALDRRRVQGILLDEIDVPIHQPYIDQIAAVPGITIMAKSKWMNVLHVRGTMQEIKGLKTLSYVSDIDFANKENEENPPVIAALKSVSEFSKGFRKNGNIQARLPNKQSETQIQMLNGHLLHQQNFTGNGKIIAVFDKGFVGVNTGAPFERIRSNNQIKGGYNFITRSDDFYSGNDHGTKVLSIMAGYVENKLVGTAPDASYYLFVTKDIITVNPLLEETLWVEAAEMADRLGVDLINSSLGYSNYNYELLDGDHAFVSLGANIAFTRGMIIVGSIGENGVRPSRYISAPADSRNVLAVGSVDAFKVRVNTSSQGPSADGRIKPDVMAMGSGVVVATEEGELDFENGTSFSTPILSGLVACLWQALPNRSNDNIIQHIKRSADRHNNPDKFYGYGIPDFYSAISLTLATDSFALNGFSIYPNPATANLTISASQQNEATAVFYNSLGQEVIRKSLNGRQETTVSLENLKAGVYFYTIVAGEATFSGKIIRK